MTYALDQDDALYFHIFAHTKMAIGLCVEYLLNVYDHALPTNSPIGYLQVGDFFEESEICLLRKQTNAGDTAGSTSIGISSIPGNASLLGWAMSSLTLKGKPSERTTLAPAPLTSMISNASSSITPVNVSSSVDMADQPAPVSPTSTDAWGELENGIHEEHECDKDGWDDVEPLEEPNPSPTLANIQAAQKRTVSQPKPQCNIIH
ncbi:unnamed protein product [Ilex paraguariensis]|uniref:Uncharacterized protein n=1 Tax=Ilex paraguariensis TaxID=185542 RepID=A0ABC8QM18_9AQUA